MALHACLDYTMTQGIFIVELPLHFSIYLARDFIAQIGVYIASDLSYIFLRKIYGTKTSIREETLALYQLETDTQSPINLSCTSHEEDERYTCHKHTTPLAVVPNYILDEWANAF